MPPIPLSKWRSGINAFRVEGRVYTGPVRARWDGRSLLVSRTLWDHALLAVASRLLVINFGAKLAEGDPRTVMASPEVRRVYMGIDI